MIATDFASQRTTSDDSVTPKCPRCASIIGRIARVRSDPQERAVDLTCADCGFVASFYGEGLIAERRRYLAAKPEDKGQR